MLRKKQSIFLWEKHLANILTVQKTSKYFDKESNILPCTIFTIHFFNNILAEPYPSNILPYPSLHLKSRNGLTKKCVICLTSTVLEFTSLQWTFGLLAMHHFASVKQTSKKLLSYFLLITPLPMNLLFQYYSHSTKY